MLARVERSMSCSEGREKDMAERKGVCADSAVRTLLWICLKWSPIAPHHSLNPLLAEAGEVPSASPSSGRTPVPSGGAIQSPEACSFLPAALRLSLESFCGWLRMKGLGHWKRCWGWA